MTITTSGDELSQLKGGRKLTVASASGNEVPQTLAVPLTALRQDGGGSFVVVGDKTGGRQVRVTVLRDADGWAALASTGLLKPGDRVAVSP